MIRTQQNTLLGYLITNYLEITDLFDNIKLVLLVFYSDSNNEVWKRIFELVLVDDGLTWLLNKYFIASCSVQFTDLI